MSYILDALKKSDRERQRGKAPGLNSIHEPHDPSPEDRSSRQQVKYIFTAIGIILLISIPAMTWYSMKDFTSPPPSGVIKETKETTAKPEKDLRPTPTTESPKLKDNDRTSPPPPSQITARPEKTILTPDQTNPPQEEKEITASPPSHKPPEIPDIESLPPSIQTTIPDLHFAGHTYSENPAQRLIIINDNILREGDKINSTIKLVEITWTGVILDQNGRQFAVNIE